MRMKQWESIAQIVGNVNIKFCLLLLFYKDDISMLEHAYVVIFVH